MTFIDFVVPGRPVPAVRMTRHGKWVSDRAKGYLAYKDQVGWAAKAAHFGLIHGPVRVEIHVFLKGQRVGDMDNYTKSILDGCNGVVWLDDTQVVELHAFRHTGRPERAEVRVTEIVTEGRVQVTEISKLLDGMTPNQAEQLIYAMERMGLVKRVFTDLRRQILEAEVKDYIAKMQVLNQRNTELREQVINLEVQLEDARIRNRVLQDRLERVIRGAVS